VPRAPGLTRAGLGWTGGPVRISIAAMPDAPRPLASLPRLRGLVPLLALAAAAVLAAPGAASAATAAKLNSEATAALSRLYASTPAAKALGEKAKAVLIFPGIVKGGFIVGGQIGEGALRKGGKTVAYYRMVAGSYGLQAGGQRFSFALFFMSDDALKYLDQTQGFEVGVGPSVVVVDEGVAKTLTTTTVRSDVYAFIFGQKGLMAGIGIQGSKISRIQK